MPERAAGFRGEFLWELDIVSGQLMALADAFPAEKYDWRPQDGARSVSEVFVHVATGNFMLLNVAGVAAPADLYSMLPPSGTERWKAFIHRNDELAATVREKKAATALLSRSMDLVKQSFAAASDSELERGLFFFGEETTVRRAYLRLLVHASEHMGQMIAYMRVLGMAAPWRDWRPDRREGQH